MMVLKGQEKMVFPSDLDSNGSRFQFFHKIPLRIYSLNQGQELYKKMSSIINFKKYWNSKAFFFTEDIWV